MTALALEDVKDFLRYSNNSNDGPLTLMLNAGQDWVERYTNRLMVQREVTQSLPAFGAYHDLRWRPYVADSLTISYLDGSFALQSFADFAVYGFGEASRLVTTSAWPIGATGINLTYTAGYETVEEVPDVMIHAVALYVAMSDQERSTIDSTAMNGLKFMLGKLHSPVLA